MLATYFAGLALGAALAARRPGGPRAYAVLELGVAATALGYLALRPLLPAVAVAAARATPPAALAAVRTLLAFVVLVVPTTLLGATLPAAAGALSPGDVAGAGRLYAWNAFGGAVGSLACGAFAIGMLGIRTTFVAAAGIDVAVALAALALVTPRSIAHAEPAPPASGRTLVLAGAAGFAGLADEVLWTRGLAGVLSNSVYSIALVVAAVLVGIVAGAAVGTRVARGRDREGAAFACLALATVGSLAALRILPAASAALATALRVAGPRGGLAVEATLAALVVVAPAACLGAVFTLLLAGDGRAAPGRTVGRLLAANTAGGIAGALGAAFVLLPRVGLGGGLVLTAAVAAAASLALPGGRPLRLAAAAAVVAASVGTPAVRLAARDGGDVLFYRDGATATVSVTRDADGGKRLRVNGQYTLGGTRGLLLEQREAHVPLLLHPAPRHVLALGVGTGDTAGAAVAHPGVVLDGVELVPEVLDAARLFAAENGGVLANPRAHLVAEDARTRLLATSERYDVILSDLFLPWTAGTASLYSLDFYRLGLARLAPGGLYCQWLPLHQLGVEDLERIVATFVAAFPHAQLWLAYHRTATPLAALVGSVDPIRADADAIRVRARDAGLAAALRAAELDDPGDLAVLYVADGVRLRAVTAGVAPITDDRPRLELTAPAAYFHQAGLGRAALAWVAARLDPAPAPVDGAPPATFALRAALLEAALALAAGDRPAELGAYVRALALAPDVPAVRLALGAIAAERRAAGDPTTARRIAELLGAAAR